MYCGFPTVTYTKMKTPVCIAALCVGFPASCLAASLCPCVLNMESRISKATTGSRRSSFESKCRLVCPPDSIPRTFPCRRQTECIVSCGIPITLSVLFLILSPRQDKRRRNARRRFENVMSHVIPMYALALFRYLGPRRCDRRRDARRRVASIMSYASLCSSPHSNSCIGFAAVGGSPRSASGS